MTYFNSHQAFEPSPLFRALDNIDFRRAGVFFTVLLILAFLVIMGRRHENRPLEQAGWR